ncbi:MAG: adenylyltransferase/cytidyltransferase family protein [Spirulina sp. SIO3F2]|nr:adenylyltransferase/cytidyltransferase family protein [Spirulina sp. SIO3F2]
MPQKPKLPSHTVFVSGSFNILHPGHLRLFRFAKECGDWLIVGVYSDRIAANAAHIPEHLRLEGVRSNSWVDEAFLLDEPITDVVSRLKPDVVVKGKEHEVLSNPEQTVLAEYGGKLLFSSGEATFSSLDLLKKEFYESRLSSISLPYEYLERHRIRIQDLKTTLQSFSNLRVCVLGDLIIDEYITCDPLGLSREDPTVVVTPIDSTQFVGGAGIVAAHASGLGATVKFCSVAGQDSTRDFAEKQLVGYGVQSVILTDQSRPTTLKQRFRCKGKTLLRVSHLHQDGIDVKLQDQLFCEINQIIQNIDLLIFSDFNYGCLPQKMIERIISTAKKQGIMIVADSQSSSQIGNISRFKGMHLLTPTEHEARLATVDTSSGLVVLAEQLRQQSKARNILLKLGEEGLLVHAETESKNDWLTDRISALNSSPKDVAGAGDSLLIASSLTLASGGRIWEAACMGSLAAAIQVSRLGNVPIQAEEVFQELAH